MSDTPPEPTATSADEAPALTGVGQRLRQAREARRLSITDVAASLRLHTRLVEALEQEAFDQFAGATFVRGHLRNYARLLDLPSDEIVAALADDSHKQRLTPELCSPPQLPEERHGSVRLATVLVALAVIGLLLVWAISHFDDLFTTDSDSDAPPLSESSEQLYSPMPLPSAEPQPPAPPPQPVAPRPAPRAMPEPLPIPPEAGDEIPVPPSIETPPEPITADPVSQPTAEAQPETATPPAGPGPELVLRYSAEAWTEVHDADGRRLLLGVPRAGEERRVSGVAPYRVVIGVARAVEVTYDGEPFDTAPHTQREIARFTVGTPEDNQ